MTEGLVFSSADRVLVLAPHPDDESLASGGLIQHALAAGAAVHVVIATDGDDNPWPQRWLEKRLRIDAAARSRWGERRCAEARAALAVLGVAPQNAEFLHWSDRRLTRDLCEHGDARTQTLAATLSTFLPSLVVAPVRADTHPDHSALRLLLDAAQRRAGTEARVLGYRIHGGGQDGIRLGLDASTLQRKRTAVLCHRSQTVFGDRRLLRFVRDAEVYVAAGTTASPPARWRWRLSARTRGPRRLLIVGYDAHGAWHCARLEHPDPAMGWIRNGVERVVDMAPLWPGMVAVWAKLERTRHPWLVFDDGGWHAPDASNAV